MKIKNKGNDFVFELSFYESLRLSEDIQETLFISQRKNGMSLNDVIYKMERIKKDLDRESFMEAHKN